MTALVINSSGVELFRIRGGSELFIVAATEIGVLLKHSKEPKYEFDYHILRGPVCHILFESSAIFLDWSEKPHSAYFTVGEDDRRLRHIDCSTGETIWECERVVRSPQVMGVGNYLIVREAHAETRNVLLALERGTGTVAAEWIPPKGRFKNVQYTWNEGRLVRWQGALFFIDASQFGEIKTEDIEAKLNGWQ
ncbi:MAG: hypothetical protein ACFFBD_26090 [Candidatus Hodarchaeota archaeon]